MILDVITEPDPRLHQVAPEAVPSDELSELLKDMVDTVIAFKGYGLAASQVGHNVRAVVVVDRSKHVVHCVLNPRIVKRSPHRVKSREGCLSMPGQIVELTRAWSVVVEAQNSAGESVRITAKGRDAAAWQHELDHLEGKTLARVGKRAA